MYEYLVSIVMPIYNSEKFLKDSVESILNQTYRNLEIILVDDGSVDDSFDICKQYAERDKRVKVFTQKNAGPSAARNLGIENCTGDFILFQDSDDLVGCDRVKIFIDSYIETPVDLIVGNINIFTKKKVVCNHINDKLYKNRKEIISDFSIIDNPLFSAPWNKLYKAEIIKANHLLFNTLMKMGEDLDFNVRYLNCISSLKFIPTPIYNYQKDNSFLSNQFRVNDYFTRKILIKTIEKYYSENDINVNVAYRYVRLALSCIMRLSHKDNKMSRKERLGYISTLKKDEDLSNALSSELKDLSISNKINVAVLKIKSPSLIYFISKFYWLAWRTF